MNFNDKNCPAPTKWSVPLWKWLKDNLEELSSRINANHKQVVINTKAVSELESRNEDLINRIVDLENQAATVLDSVTINSHKLGSVTKDVLNLKGIHDGDELVLVFEQAGQQPVARFYGQMTFDEAQDFVNKKGRPLYVANCITPEDTEEEE